MRSGVIDQIISHARQSPIIVDSITPERVGLIIKLELCHAEAAVMRLHAVPPEQLQREFAAARTFLGQVFPAAGSASKRSSASTTSSTDSGASVDTASSGAPSLAAASLNTAITRDSTHGELDRYGHPARPGSASTFDELTPTPIDTDARAPGPCEVAQPGDSSPLRGKPKAGAHSSVVKKYPCPLCYKPISNDRERDVRRHLDNSCPARTYYADRSYLACAHCFDVGVPFQSVAALIAHSHKHVGKGGAPRANKQVQLRSLILQAPLADRLLPELLCRGIPADQWTWLTWPVDRLDWLIETCEYGLVPTGYPSPGGDQGYSDPAEFVEKLLDWAELHGQPVPARLYEPTDPMFPSPKRAVGGRTSNQTQQNCDVSMDGTGNTESCVPVNPDAAGPALLASGPTEQGWPAPTASPAFFQTWASTHPALASNDPIDMHTPSRATSPSRHPNRRPWQPVNSMVAAFQNTSFKPNGGSSAQPPNLFHMGSSPSRA